MPKTHLGELLNEAVRQKKNQQKTDEFGTGLENNMTKTNLQIKSEIRVFGLTNCTTECNKRNWEKII